MTTCVRGEGLTRGRLDARGAFGQDRGVEEELGRQASAPKRVVLAALLTIVGLNVWTGGPLLALWVGSRVQGSGPPTMGAVFVVVVVLAAVCLLLAAVFARLNQTYQDMTGQVSTVRQHTPWLRSMRGERPQYQGVEPTLTTPERILVGMVVVAFVLFEIWFFFFSGSPIDNRSGRAALVPQIPLGIAAPAFVFSSGDTSERVASADLELVRWLVDAWNRRDLTGFASKLHPEIDWVPGMIARAEAGAESEFRGTDGFWRWVAATEDIMDEYRIDADRAEALEAAGRRD